MILSIYQEKIKTDGVDRREQQSMESLPVFVTEFMLFQYGEFILYHAIRHLSFEPLVPMSAAVISRVLFHDRSKSFAI
jgi:hypothetical protein